MEIPVYVCLFKGKFYGAYADYSAVEQLLAMFEKIHLQKYVSVYEGSVVFDAGDR